MNDEEVVCCLCDKPETLCRCREEAEAEWDRTRPNVLSTAFALCGIEFALGLLGYALYQLLH